VNTIPTFILIAFPVVWILAGILLYASRGPWRKLAEVYGFEGEIPTQFWAGRTSGRLGWRRFRGAFTVSADTRGIYFKMSCMPPRKHLFVPWEDIFIVENERFLEKTSKLTFRRMPAYPIELERSVVERLLQARGGTGDPAPI
jgi:hypothetical protein